MLLVAPSAVLLEARRKEFARSMQEVLAQGQEQRATCQVQYWSRGPPVRYSTGAEGHLSGTVLEERATCHIGTIHKGGAHQSFKTPVLVQ